MLIISTNKKAGFDFHLNDRFEAGLVLQGTEVKSLRAGKSANLADAYAGMTQGEMFIYNFHIPEYAQGNIHNHEPRRKRKLLLNRHEIDKISGKLKQRGFTLIPTKLYFKDGRVKIELALAEGKNKGDKRQAIKERDDKRHMAKALKTRR